MNEELKTLQTVADEIVKVRKKYIAKAEKERQERLEIAKQQGLSYNQWLDLEEVNRQSEEFERLMGI